ncbi:hypothetical protein RUND412_006552 [Rhizina undulata]
MEEMDADSFYDKLLASIQIPHSDDSHPNHSPQSPALPSPKQKPASHVSRSASPAIPSPFIPLDEGDQPAFVAEPAEALPLPPASYSAPERNSIVEEPAVFPVGSKPKEEAPEVPKTPADLEAELRRKLLETTRKRKSITAQIYQPSEDIIEKRPKITSSLPAANPSQHTLPPKPIGPETEELVKARVAELRRKLLQRSALKKVIPPGLSLLDSAPSTAKSVPDGRCESPISISSDEGAENLVSAGTSVESLGRKPNLSLPLRPPARTGFKLRITVPFTGTKTGNIVVTTEVMPLETPLDSFLDLFGFAGEGDHIYFPNPRVALPSASKKFKGKEVREEESYSEEASGESNEDEERTISRAEKVEAPLPPQGIHSRLRGDAPEFSPAIPNEVTLDGAQSCLNEVTEWRGGCKTLEDVWTGGKTIVDCYLVHGDPDEEDDEYDPSQPWPPHPRSSSQVSPANNWRKPEDPQTEEIGDDEYEPMIEEPVLHPPPNHKWGYQHGQEFQQDSNFAGWNQNFDPSLATGAWGMQPQFQYGMNQNMSNPPTPWFSHPQGFSQSPTFPDNNMPFPVPPNNMPNRQPAGQAMHWVPGHMDYTAAGWIFGFNEQGEGNNVGDVAVNSRPNHNVENGAPPPLPEAREDGHPELIPNGHEDMETDDPHRPGLADKLPQGPRTGSGSVMICGQAPSERKETQVRRGGGKAHGGGQPRRPKRGRGGGAAVARGGKPQT